MSTIHANRGIVTQINVFKVPSPDRQQPLIELLKQAAQSVRDVPGWMSANIHRSLDGTRVVNYAQCDSTESWQAVMRKLEEGGYLRANKAFGIPEPGLYEVVFVLESESLA